MGRLSYRELRVAEFGANQEAVLTFGDRYHSILVVEDDALVRESTIELLGSAGYEVFIAWNSEEALRVYGKHGSKIDLLLTDVVLPGRSGRELAETLQRRNPALKTLFMTGYPEQMEASEKDLFLAKPFCGDQLLQVVKKLLESSEGGSNIRESVVREELMLACGGV